MRAGLIMISAVMTPGQTLAQTAEPAPSPAAERRLSPQQIDAVLAEAAKKREAAEMRVEPGSDEQAPRPQVQGEVGFAIGTGGYRQFFGTAIAPLGGDGMVAISLDHVDWGKRRLPR